MRTGMSVSVSSGSTSKNDLNSPPKLALNAGVTATRPSAEATVSNASSSSVLAKPVVIASAIDRARGRSSTTRVSTENPCSDRWFVAEAANRSASSRVDDGIRSPPLTMVRSVIGRLLRRGHPGLVGRCVRYLGGPVLLHLDPQLAHHLAEQVELLEDRLQRQPCVV